MEKTLPPHFQLSTKAKTQDREIIKITTMIHMVRTVGRFGLSDPIDLCVTVGVKKRGCHG